MSQLLRVAVLVGALLLAAPTYAYASVQAGQPFPTNLDTRIDFTQLTFLRVALPKPNCTVHVSDCQDIDVLNSLDGFNVDARISIPFSGDIDLTTVTPNTVYLVDPFGGRVPLDRLVWTAATHTLHGNPQTYLNQHTPYLLVVTDGVKAKDGSDISPLDFRKDQNFGQTKDFGAKLYRAALLAALHWAQVSPSRIIDASLFTTQSVTSLLEKVRRQIDASRPAPASFAIGSGGARAVFPFANITSVTTHRQVGTSTFSDSPLPFSAVPVFPGAIGTAAYGSFSSPDYENAQKVIPPIGTGFFSWPEPQATNTLYFNLWLPSGTEPAGGWPVAIVGHGFTDSKQGFPITTASTLAHNGIATIAINVVGHGGGPLGTMTVTRTDGPPVTFSAGGRGIDQDGNGTIDSFEGVNAAAPFTAVSSRDGLRQTVIDLMQLVREIQVGIDVNGDGAPDLDASKIGYFGQSFGGIYGTTFMAVEPDVHAGVVNVPGGSISEIARLSPSFRSLVGFALFTRTPSLYNVAPDPILQNFVENMPLSGEPPPPRIDTVPGADAIQSFVDEQIWAQTPADPVAYASHIRAQPLFGVSPKAIIVQFAKGDETVPNPTASALIRAGGLEDRATYFRNDLAFALVPGYTVKNPHTFLSNIFDPKQAPFAVGAQLQIAAFLASGGTVTVDPDGAGPFFETPIAGPLPETVNFLP